MVGAAVNRLLAAANCHSAHYMSASINPRNLRFPGWLELMLLGAANRWVYHGVLSHAHDEG